MAEKGPREKFTSLSTAETKALLTETSNTTMDIAGFVELVSLGDVRDPKVVITLYKGTVDIPFTEPTSPINYITDFLYEDYFHEMSRESRGALLKGVSKISYGEYQKSFGEKHTRINESGKLVQHRDLELKDEGRPAQAFNFLHTVMKYTDGNVDDAEKLIKDGGTMDGKIPLNYHLRDPFYHLFINAAQESTVGPLAFRVYAMLGGTNPRTYKFDLLLLQDFEKSSNRIKVEIIRYVSETIRNGDVPSNKLYVVKTFLQKQEALYKVLKQKLPNSPFVTSYEKAWALLKLEQFMDQTKDGRISPDQMLDVLSEFPGYLELLSVKDLEVLQDACKDHGMIMRFTQLIRARKAIDAKNTPSQGQK